MQLNPPQIPKKLLSQIINQIENTIFDHLTVINTVQPYEQTQPPISKIVPTESQPNQQENPPSENIHTSFNIIIPEARPFP